MQACTNTARSHILEFSSITEALMVDIPGGTDNEYDGHRKSQKGKIKKKKKIITANEF